MQPGQWAGVDGRYGRGRQCEKGEKVPSVRSGRGAASWEDDAGLDGVLSLSSTSDVVSDRGEYSAASNSTRSKTSSSGGVGLTGVSGRVGGEGGVVVQTMSTAER